MAEVLSYVEYGPEDLESRFRRIAEQAVEEGAILASQRRDAMNAFRSSLRGYTSFEG